MHPVHYLEDEDADASDIHDVSFQSNDSTLVANLYDQLKNLFYVK